MANEHSLYTPRQTLYGGRGSLYHPGFIPTARNPRITEDDAERHTEDGLYYRVTEQVLA